MKLLSHVWLFLTPWTAACQPPLSLEFSRQEYWSGYCLCHSLPLPSPGDLPDPGIEPGSPYCHCLLQGIFLTQGLNPGLPHCRQVPYYLSHQGSPRILEWVAYPFSRGSSWPSNQTGVSYIAGGFFTSRATREAPCFLYQNLHGLNFIFLGCIIFSRRNL